MKEICVIGSSNTDLVVKSRRFPQQGETIIGDRFFMNPGGKGANQAVAAARLQGKVGFVSCLGDDLFGASSLQNLQNQGISTALIKTVNQPSGVALITVNQKGENTIVVAPGANNLLDTKLIDKAFEQLKEQSILLLQLEIPLESVLYAVIEGTKRGHQVILNPAPGQPLPEHIYRHLFILTPNETETEILTGIKITDDESARRAARVLLRRGAENVIITRGAKGAFLQGKEMEKLMPALPVSKLVDTTAAGDCFNGALAVGIAQGMSIIEAAEFGSKAASLSVTRLGAQSSLPTLDETLKINSN
ncbi:MAG: ribokinase [Bacteroidota bacterium]